MFFQTLKSKAHELKALTGLLYLACQDSRTPWYAKAVMVMVISYALSPIDLIPDFIPGLGYLDDLILIPAGIALAIKLIPDDVLRQCREKAQSPLNIKVNPLYAVIFIGAIWLMLIYIIIKLIWNMV
jgi:uncharacterized membrane protein YkvA (DUF1232 family)